MSADVDPTIAKIGASVVGALVSLNFVRGTLPERLSMAAGGASLSYYSSDYIAHSLHMGESIGLVGFLIGLFGMAIVAKVYEGITTLEVKRIINDLLGRFLKR